MKKQILCILLLFVTVLLHAQELELKWSEEFRYDNKIDGFFDNFLGSNNKYVYAKFSNLAKSPSSYNKKIKLIAFDKENMSRVGEVRLRGYGKDKEKRDLKYYRTIILDKVIYVLWTKEKKDLLEIYAESYDNTLRNVNPLKKIYEISRSRKATDNFFVVYNKDIGNKILLGKEFAIKEKGEKLRFEYKLLNEDFSLASSQQITLPIVATSKPRRDASYNNLECRYELGDDGKIYIQSIIRMNEEERKGLKKREAYTYPVFMQVEPETGKLREHPVKFSGKNTFNLSSVVSKDGVRVYGFFCDLEKDPKGNDSHGIFYVSFDSRDFSIKAEKLSYFDKKFLDQLYADDKENQKKGKGLLKSKSAKASDEESIDDNYVIEQVIEDNGDILLFCSIMNNWSRRYCSTSSNGVQSCYYKYYCTKNNITTFKLNSKGEIMWAKNLDRSITYDGWNIYDVSVIKGEKDYFLVYGSAYQMNANKKNRRNTKSKEQLTDRFEYAVCNAQTGDLRKAEYQVNKLGTKSKNKKYVQENHISLLDNRMYTECNRVKYKGSTWFGLIFPPSLFILMNSPAQREGKGYIGTISAR